MINQIMKMKKKDLLSIFCLIFLILIVISIYIYNDYRIKKLVKNLSEPIYYLNNNVQNYIINNNNLYHPITYKKKKYVAKTNLFGFANGYIQVADNGDVIAKVNVNGLCYYTKKNKIKVKPIGCDFSNESYETHPYEQIYVVPKTGIYKISLWGSSGGISANYTGDRKKTGQGAYVSGEIKLNKGNVLFLHVGSKGKSGKKVNDEQLYTAFGDASIGGIGGYNGGGNGYDDPEGQAAGGGGGATDIRLISGKWDDFESLKSRIIVAAGGGGMSRYYKYEGSPHENTGIAGSGGTLTGIAAVATSKIENDYGLGATQTTGYLFGKGQNGTICMTTLNGIGGGGSGYFGAKSGDCPTIDWVPPTGAGGGSSYVSGCKGCNSISEESTEDNLKFTGRATHYSGLQFNNIKMMSGNEKMPTKKENSTMVGNLGDGYARIEYLRRK